MPAEFLTDGHPTIIDFLDPGGSSNAVVLQFKEVSVTPPGMQGGGENDTTTMRNSTWRTRQPKKLTTLSPSTLTVSYNPDLYDAAYDPPVTPNWDARLLDMLNKNTQIRVTFSDGSTLTFWGWLDEFTPNEAVEGEMPTAEITVIPSNQDNNNTEQVPVLSTLP